MLKVICSSQLACRSAPRGTPCFGKRTTLRNSDWRARGSYRTTPQYSPKYDKVRKFYEEGWGTDTSVLDTLLSENHVQVDRVWGAGPKEGRESMKKGIEIFRRFYPDVKFTVSDMATADASDNSDKVFVHWSMTGTFEGVQDTSYGLTLMTFDMSGQIKRSEVFRQATRAEIVSAQRSERGLVPQAAVMEKSNSN